MQLRDGRVVGEILDRVMKKRVIMGKPGEKSHFYRKLRAWCLDVYGHEFYRGQFDWVELTDMENAIQYRLHVEQIDLYGTSIDEGAGEQIAVPKKHWQTAPAAFYQVRMEL